MRRFEDVAKGGKGKRLRERRVEWGHLTEEPKSNANTWLSAAEELREFGAIHGPRCGRCEWEREHGGWRCIGLVEELIALKARDLSSAHAGD